MNDLKAIKFTICFALGLFLYILWNTIDYFLWAREISYAEWQCKQRSNRVIIEGRGRYYDKNA